MRHPIPADGLTEIPVGLFASTELGRFRLYAGAGPLMKFGWVDVESDRGDTTESEFGIDPSLPEGSEGQVWPPEAVRIAWTGRLRGHDVALLEWFPVRWSPGDGTVLVSRGLTATVRFVTGDGGIDGTAPSPAGPDGDPYAGSLVRALVRNPGALGSVADGVATGVDGRAGSRHVETPGIDAGTAIAPVKLEITGRGIYRVSGSDLTSAGVDLTGVDPREIVVRNGPDAIDILLEGEADSVFDPSDTIVFYGEGLDTRTTGNNVYWIETTTATAARMATRDVTPLGAPLATSFRNSVRREESALYTSNSPPQQPTEHWWWERLDVPPNASWDDSSDTYRVTLANLPIGAARARLLLNVQGRSNQQPKPDHNSRLLVNGNLVDDQMWNDIESFTHDVTFDASLLIEGENVITRYRELMGATNYEEAAEGTIRKAFATDIEQNVVHGSDAPETAAFEIAYFFNQLEML